MVSMTVRIEPAAGLIFRAVPSPESARDTVREQSLNVQIEAKWRR